MTDFVTLDSRMTNALDFSGLAQMRAGAVQGKERVTKEVAQQFESIFINMMLKSMRDATERSGLLDSEATKTYESMFDQQMSTELAGKGTFGIAQALQNQLNLNTSKSSRGDYMPLNQTRSYELKQGDGSYELQRAARALTFARGDL